MFLWHSPGKVFLFLPCYCTFSQINEITKRGGWGREVGQNWKKGEGKGVSNKGGSSWNRGVKNPQWAMDEEFSYEVGFLSSAEHLLGFGQGSFQFTHNALTHLATLPRNKKKGKEILRALSWEQKKIRWNEKRWNEKKFSYLFMDFKYVNTKNRGHNLETFSAKSTIPFLYKNQNFKETLGRNIDF